MMKDRFLPYEEAKAFVHSLEFKNWKEWRAYRNSGKRPPNIPSRPDIIYKNKGWINGYEWLGTEIRTFLSYDEAKALVHTFKLKNCKEWNAYSKSEKRPRNIPSNPYEIYKNKEWIDWGDWLGKEKFLSYDEAKEFVHSLKLKGWYDWNDYSKSGERPRNIPSNPHKFYQNKGWINFCDWLGTTVERFLSYEEAKAFVHTLKLKSKIEWQGYCNSEKRSRNIPSNPDKFYKNKGWLSWYDWLGKEQKSKKEIS